jgi:DNA-binding FadR family transcriptional regulator
MASTPRGTAPKMPKGLVRSATHAIGHAIVRGEYAPGAVLPGEDALAVRFGVSRTGLREAIKVLSGKGLVRTARRYGSRVCPREEWNYLDPDVLGWHLSDPANLPQFLRDIGEMRMLLEPEAASLAASRATPAEQRRILALAIELPIVSTEQSVETDIAFHLAVLRASHNLIIAGLCPAMEVLLRAYFLAMWQLHPYGPRNVSHINLHQLMAEAIAAGNATDARAHLEAMLEITCREIDEVLGMFGPQPPGAFALRVSEFAGLFRS